MSRFNSFHQIAQNMSEVQLNRRKLVQRAGLLAFSVTGIASLLTACADDDDDSVATDDDVAVEPDTDDADEEEDPQDDDEEEPDTDDAAPDEQRGGEVTVGWRQPSTIHPLFTTGHEQQIESLVFGTLVKMNNELEPIPDLSETIEASEDARQYTFNLHDNIMFTDGVQLTSADPKFTLERGLHPDTAGSRWVGRLANVEGAAEYRDGSADEVSGINTPDDLTVEINLIEPEAAFLPNLCNFSGLGILPKHHLEDIAPEDMQGHTFGLQPDVSAGAFKVARFETDQFMELERNDDYFRGPPNLDRIFLRILDDSVAVAQLETGEMDIMNLPYAEIDRTEQMEHVSIYSTPSPMMTFLTINLTGPKFQDKNLRQAMMYALDREGMLQAAKHGHGVVRNSPIFGPEWMGIPEGLNEYPYDPDRARELLAESDWDENDSIEIMINTDYDDAKHTAVAIVQAQWQEVGIQAEILDLDTAPLNERFNQQDFDVRIIGGGVFGADPAISGIYFTTANFAPGGPNYGHYSDETVDDLYVQGQSTGDLDERREIYTELAQILNEELPWIFLYSPNSVHAVSNRVVGFEAPGYMDNKLWNAHEWSVRDE